MNDIEVWRITAGFVLVFNGIILHSVIQIYFRFTDIAPLLKDVRTNEIEEGDPIIDLKTMIYGSIIIISIGTFLSFFAILFPIFVPYTAGPISLVGLISMLIASFTLYKETLKVKIMGPKKRIRHSLHGPYSHRRR